MFHAVWAAFTARKKAKVHVLLFNKAGIIHIQVDRRQSFMCFCSIKLAFSTYELIGSHVHACRCSSSGYARLQLADAMP